MTAGAPSRVSDLINGHFNRTPVEDRAAGEVDQYDSGMLGDLEHLAEAIRYAWVEAWEPATHDPDAPARVLTPEEAALVRSDDCFVPGATFSVGGNTQARDALEAAGNNLAACDALLDVACQVASAGEGRRKLPAVRHHRHNAPLGDFEQHIDSLRWRLHFIVDRATRLDNETASRVLAELRLADKKLRAAAGPLDAIRRKATKDASIGVDRFCVTCEKRTVRPGGTECPTCQTYRTRHGGEARPRELDAA